MTEGAADDPTRAGVMVWSSVPETLNEMRSLRPNSRALVARRDPGEGGATRAAEVRRGLIANDARASAPTLHRLAIGCALVVVGCASYAPRPLDPSAGAHAFVARTLDDPGLVRFVHVQPDAPGVFPPSRWGVADLTFVAWYFHADMAAARARRDTARAMRAEHSAAPNPGFGFDLERVTNGGPRPWALGFTFDIPLDVSGKRDARRAVAAREEEAAELTLVDTAWRMRSRVRAAQSKCVFADRALAIARNHEQLRERAAVAARQAVEAGEDARSASARATASWSQSRVDLAAAARAASNARTALTEALGVPASAVADLDLEEPEALAPSIDLEVEAAQAHGLANRVDLRLALVEYARAEDALRLEVANQYPDIQLLPGHQWDQGAHKLRFGFSLPLPIFDDHRPAIDRALAERSEAEAKFLGAQQQALAAIESALARYAALRKEAESSHSMLREDERVQRAAEVELAAGAIGSRDMLDTRLARVALERAALDVDERVDEALGALEDAMQCPLANAMTAATPESHAKLEP